jgi:hypothetical protein
MKVDSVHVFHHVRVQPPGSGILRGGPLRLKAWVERPMIARDL